MASASAPTPISFFSTSLLPQAHKIGTHQKSRKRSSTTIVSASRNEAHDQNYYQNYYSGRGLVDENMIVLRKRIHEMKMVEKNYEPPSHWMGWEKNCYVGYDEFICELMGLLQAQLMNTRPCLALGLVVLVGLSVSTSGALVLIQFMEMITGLVARVHLN